MFVATHNVAVTSAKNIPNASTFKVNVMPSANLNNVREIFSPSRTNGNIKNAAIRNVIIVAMTVMLSLKFGLFLNKGSMNAASSEGSSA